MKYYAIEGNIQRLDGGSMFGNCPRVLWEKWIAPDDNHNVTLASRCLLVHESPTQTYPEGRRILFETGVGAFFEPKLAARYGVLETDHMLLKHLAVLGLSPQQIDIVVLSHLHFDHLGGLCNSWQEGKPLSLAFTRAQFIVGERQWHHARYPHARDRVSYVPEINALLKNSGRLHIIPEGETSSALLGDNYLFHYSDGHTPGMMLTEVKTVASGAINCGGIMFMGDLVPGAAWVHLPITMGYDRFPEQVIDEKTAIFPDLIQRRTRLFFTHDPVVTCTALSVKTDLKGLRPRYTAVESIIKSATGVTGII